MRNGSGEIWKRYTSGLGNHLVAPDETTLLDGYELGRLALREGYGVLDMAAIYHDALRAILDPGPIGALHPTFSRAAEFFAESLSAFEMSLSGYRETNERLVAMNETLVQAKAAIDAANRVLEERVRERTAELARSNEALKQEIAERKEAEARLIQAQKMEAIGNLTGGMAHDFNNMLGVIIGNLDLVIERAKDQDTQELLDGALDAALRGGELVRSLLAFARRQSLQPERIDVNALVGMIVKLLTRTLGEEIEISSELAPDLWPVVADPAQLEAAIVNLANNARDAMPKGGCLTIATANSELDADYATLHPGVVPGEYVSIVVTDTGTGIAPELIGRIFEPFFTTKEEGKGTGLGLSMVFGFVKQSAGHVEVYSEVGIGTSFRVCLPRVAATAGEARPTGGEDMPLGAGETVLLVEDHDGLRRVAKRQLADLGYRVIEAPNATAALALLEREPADLLFTDIVMAGPLNGLDLARTARSRWPAMRVLLTSGFAARVGGTAVDDKVRKLLKPYRKADLARALRDALQG